MGALAVILLGAAPMAAAAVNRTADPILALAISGNSTSLNLPAPGFSLTDQNGRTVSLASLRGKVVLMTFLDPVCTTDCPIIAQEFKQAGQMLGAQAKNVELVAVVANPTYRSTAFTRAFDRQEGLTTVPDWLYLTGSLSQLGAVWRHYGVTVENLPAGAMAAHNDLAVVIDPAGRIRQELSADPGPATSEHQILVLRAAQPVRPAGAEAIVSRRAGPDPRRAGLALACAGLIAGCGSQPATVAGTGPPAVTAPLSTSLATAQGTWAIAVMGGSARRTTTSGSSSSGPRTAGRWSLVTPQGVADNGGLVAAGGSASLVVGFRPSQNLALLPAGHEHRRRPELDARPARRRPGRYARRHRGRAIGAHPRAAAGRHDRGGADGGRRGRRAVGAAGHAQGAGGVRPGSLLRAGGRDRRLVRPR